MNAFDQLMSFESWQLHRVSANTHPYDVIATFKRNDVPISDAEVAAITKLLREGNCYRCRIGRSRYFFAETALKAAGRKCVANETKVNDDREVETGKDR